MDRPIHIPRHCDKIQLKSLSYHKSPWASHKPRGFFFSGALTDAAAEWGPLSFAAYELAVRVEHIEVSLTLAGKRMW